MDNANILNESVMDEQLKIMKEFLSHYSSFRTLLGRFEELCQFGSQEFWVYTINAHYFQAINLWCMVFGTDNNEVHWKRVGLGLGFKEKILSSIDILNRDYTRYWDSVKEWRNKYSAHRSPDYRAEKTPDLKMARKVVLLYEEWLEEQTGFIFTSSLEVYEDYFKEQLGITINVLLTSEENSPT